LPSSTDFGRLSNPAEFFVLLGVD
jgi:hypothetical protein